MNRLRILLVEDDRESREALRTLLEVLGHEVEEAEDGERAITLAFTRRPDLILLDVGLPGLSGHEVAQRIRGERGGDAFFVVAFTGHQPWDRALPDGFDGCLVKPVDLEQLEELLAAVSTGSARETSEQGGEGDHGARPRPSKPVLLVEDDTSLREAVVAALEREGYRVVPAAHGREALDLLHGGVEPCLIVLDLMMPVMNGWDFRRAQLADPDLAPIPVLVVSAHQGARNLAASKGVKDVLVKPIDFEELLGHVEAACQS